MKKKTFLKASSNANKLPFCQYKKNLLTKRNNKKKINSAAKKNI